MASSTGMFLVSELHGSVPGQRALRESFLVGEPHESVLVSKPRVCYWSARPASVSGRWTCSFVLGWRVKRCWVRILSVCRFSVRPASCLGGPDLQHCRPFWTLLCFVVFMFYVLFHGDASWRKIIHFEPNNCTVD